MAFTRTPFQQPFTIRKLPPYQQMHLVIYMTAHRCTLRGVNLQLHVSQKIKASIAPTPTLVARTSGLTYMYCTCTNIHVCEYMYRQ